MKIGEFANVIGMPVETIRFYEHEELLPAPQRTENNYRNYTQTDADWLGFIGQCRSLDMTLDEVRVLLRFKDAPHQDCGEVDAMLDAHIGHVALRLRDLHRLEEELQALRSQCAARHLPSRCGILDGIEMAAGQPDNAPSRWHVRGTHWTTPSAAISE